MAHPTYRLKDGTVIPSVTQVLRRNLGWDKEGLLRWYASMARAGKSPEAVRDKAGAFGTLAHAMLERGRKNIKTPEDVEGLLTPVDWKDAERVLTRYRTWVRANKVKVIHSEISLVSEKLGFGGTIDRVATLNGEEYILDFKTSKSIKLEHFVQLSAYQALYKEVKRRELPVILLHVGRGDAPVKPYVRKSLRREWKVFRMLLELETLRNELEAR